MRPVRLRKIPGKVRFGVWIDILAKEKFANLSNDFLFLFSFISNLCLVYFIFFFVFFLGAQHNEQCIGG